MKFKFLSIFILISLIIIPGVFFKTNTAHALVLCSDRSALPHPSITVDGITYNSGDTGDNFFTINTTPGHVFNISWNFDHHTAGNGSYYSGHNMTPNQGGPVTTDPMPSSGTVGLATITSDLDCEFVLGYEPLTNFINIQANIIPNSDIPSGTISATNCAIAKDASTCNSFVTWTTAHLIPGASTAVTANNATRTISTQTSGTNVSTPVTYGPTTFFLYHNGSEPSLAQTSVTADCAPGTNWNGTTCSTDPTPTGTISAGNCDTSVTPYQTLVTWTTANLVTGGITEVTHNNPDNTHVSWATSGTNVTVPINSNTIFYLYHNGLQLASTAPVSCVSNNPHWELGPFGACDITTGMQTATYTCVPTGLTCTDKKPSDVTQTCATSNGVCSKPAKHYSCYSGNTTGTKNNISSWTWTCNPLVKGGSPSPLCTELKKKPTFIEN